MPDHAKQRGKICTLQSKPQICIKNGRSELYCDKCLEHINKDHADGEFSAINTVKIRQTRIMTAVLADIISVKQKRRDDCAVTAAGQIGACRNAEHQRRSGKIQLVHHMPPKNRILVILMDGVL